ncbi:MAG: hemerythrin domain-containing protein [Burkholderiaceae bacterium]
MTATSKPAHGKGEDAIAFLTHQHDEVKKLFKQFDKIKDGDAAQKAELAQQICNALIVHTKIENEIFYPAVRGATHADDMMNEALVEHDSAKWLIDQLGAMKPDDPMYAAKVTVLGEYFNHHVEEEEKEMFPQAKKAKLDMHALGEQLAARAETIKQEVQSPGGAKTAAGKKPKQSA